MYRKHRAYIIKSINQPHYPPINPFWSQCQLGIWTRVEESLWNNPSNNRPYPKVGDYDGPLRDPNSNYPLQEVRR